MLIEHYQFVVLALLTIIMVLQVFNLVVKSNGFAAKPVALSEIHCEQISEQHDIGGYQEAKNYAAVLRKVEKSISSNSKDPGLFRYKGIAAYHLEHWQVSMEAFNQSIALEPRFENTVAPYIKVLNRKLAEKAEAGGIVVLGRGSV
jgi:tetratricopeptide (TPR) repeat protein